MPVVTCFVYHSTFIHLSVNKNLAKDSSDSIKPSFRSCDKNMTGSGLIANDLIFKKYSILTCDRLLVNIDHSTTNGIYAPPSED